MDAMKEVNKVIGKQGKYKNLTQKDIDEIVEKTEDFIFQRDPDDLYVEDRPMFKKKTTSSLSKKDKLKKELSDIEDKIEDMIESGVDEMDPRLDKLNTRQNELGIQLDFENKMDSGTQVFKDSEGGIKGITMGGDDEFKKAMSEAMEEGMRESENMKRLGLDPSKSVDFDKYEKMKELGQLEKNVTGLADMSETDMLMQKYPGMDKLLARQIATDTNPKRKADVIAMVEQTFELNKQGKSGDEIIDIFKNTKRTKQADGGITQLRKGYVEGGPIYPRLGELSSGVSSAEEQLQQINQSLQTAETNLGESGQGGAGSVTPSVNGYESSGSSLYNESPAGEVNNPYQAPVGMDPIKTDLIKSPMFNMGPVGMNPFDNPQFDPQITNLNQLPSGPGKIDNQGQDPFRDPITGGGQPFYGTGGRPPPEGGLGGLLGGGGPSLTQIAPKAADPYNNTTLSGLSQDGQRFDSAQNAFDALAAQTQKYRESSPYSRDVIGSELYRGEEGFKNFTNYFNKINNPSYTAPQLQGQLQSSGGGLGGFFPGKGGMEAFGEGATVNPYAPPNRVNDMMQNDPRFQNLQTGGQQNTTLNGGLFGNNSGKIMDTRDRSNDNRSYEERVRLAQEANDAPTGIMRNDGTRADLTYRNFSGLPRPFDAIGGSGNKPQITNLNQLPTGQPQPISEERMNSLNRSTIGNGFYDLNKGLGGLL